MDSRVVLVLLLCIKLGWSWRTCYICSGQYPDQTCIRYPQLGTQVNCTRSYCTVSARYMLRPGASYAPKGLGPEDYETMSISRSCENVNFGNKCVKDWRGPHMTCYTTCFNSFCNDGIRTPGPEMFSAGSEDTKAQPEQVKNSVVHPRADNVITEDQPVNSGASNFDAGYVGGYPSGGGRRPDQNSQHPGVQQHKPRDGPQGQGDRSEKSRFSKEQRDKNRSLPGPRTGGATDERTENASGVSENEAGDKERGETNSKGNPPTGRKALGRGQNDKNTHHDKNSASLRVSGINYILLIIFVLTYCSLINS